MLETASDLMRDGAQDLRRLADQNNDDAQAAESPFRDAGLSPAEAARRLGVSRSRVYALVDKGELDAVGTGSLRICLASIERRLALPRPVGQALSPSSAWAVLALASADAAFRAHVAARLSDPDRSRARARLVRHGLLELLPRLRGRGTVRRFAVGAESRLDLLADGRLILAGPSAARALGWSLPEDGWPFEAYVAEAALVDVVEHYALEPDGTGEVVLRSVPEPWPFPPQARVVPELVAALDLADGPTPELAELGRARLVELTATLEPAWRRRPPRPRRIRPVIPSRAPAPAGRRLHAIATGEVWDDRAERDARGLVALLFVLGGPRRRADLAEALRVSSARLERACAFLRASPPHGLSLLEHAEQLQLVTAPDCGRLVERVLEVAPPEPLSQAALEVLAIVAYEQPVSRADVSHIRGTDSSGVVDTLLARGLIADDARYGGRGRPAFLVTTDQFLRHMGLSSLQDLPPRPVPTSP